jgi:transcriptional regulator with GAF, ATPase, and Fis domain
MESDRGNDTVSHVDQHETELDVLAEIAEVVSHQSGPRQLLTSVLAALERGLEMLRGTVMLLPPDGNEILVDTACDALAAEGRNARYRVGEGIVSQVVQTGEPAVVPRVSGEPWFQNRFQNRPTEDCAEVSVLCVPIRMEGKVVGALSVDLPVQPPELLAQRVRVLKIVASMISHDVRSRQGEAVRRQFLEAEDRRLPPGLLKARVETLEREMIVDALKSTRGSVTRTAAQLGITPRMIRYKMKKLGIDPRQFTGPAMG